jgi:hypothetical protein
VIPDDRSDEEYEESENNEQHEQHDEYDEYEELYQYDKLEKRDEHEERYREEEEEEDEDEAEGCAELFQRDEERDASTITKVEPTRSSPSEILDPLRERLVHLFKTGKLKNAKKAPKISSCQEQNKAVFEEEDMSVAQKRKFFRQLDREIAWHSFLYQSNAFANEISLAVFGEELAETEIFVIARLKVQDVMKSYKYRLLKRTEVCQQSCQYIQTMPVSAPADLV